MLDDKLSDLQRMLPKGEWSSTERTIILPSGEKIQVSSEEVSAVNLKLIIEFFTLLASQLEQIEEDYEWMKQNASIYKKDLEFYQEKSTYFRSQGYNQAIDEIVEFIADKEVMSVKLRNELRALMDDIEQFKFQTK